MLESETAAEGGGGCSLQTTDQPRVNPMKRDNQSQELLVFWFCFVLL